MRLIQSIKARRALVIADTCQSGAFSELQRDSAQISLEEFIKEFRSSANRIIIASSRASEISQEAIQFRNGVFTHFLLKGLKGDADTDKDGFVTIEEAYDYTYAAIRKLSGYGQHPHFDGRVDGFFPLSITRGR